MVSRYRAVVIGASAGGIRAVGRILDLLPADFALPILVAQHIGTETGGYYPRSLQLHGELPVVLAEDKTQPSPGTVHVAPPGLHLLVEPDRWLALSDDEPVKFSRPSIDVLFESAAQAYGTELVGVVLTGANTDGSRGLAQVHEFGGTTIVQDPQTAEVATMPQGAVQSTQPDYIASLDGIGTLLARLSTEEEEG